MQIIVVNVPIKMYLYVAFMFCISMCFFVFGVSKGKITRLKRFKI